MSTSTPEARSQHTAGGDRPPMTRREMKARGMLLTTEIPVIAEPPGWGGRASVAVAAQRSSLDRRDATRAVAPSAPEAGAAIEGEAAGASDESAEPSGPSTATRPVVRVPTTARGLRTIDETGAITGVQAAVGRAVESATSPSSWESAVALPGVALGITDFEGAPTEVGTAGATDEAPGVEVDVGDGDLAGEALPMPPEASEGWGALLDEQEAAQRDDQAARARVEMADDLDGVDALDAAEEVEFLDELKTLDGDDDEPEVADIGEAGAAETDEVEGRVDALDAAEEVVLAAEPEPEPEPEGAPDLMAATRTMQEAARARVERQRAERARRRKRMRLMVIGGAVAVVAVVVLIVLLATGLLGSPFATADGARAAGTLALGVLGNRGRPRPRPPAPGS